MRPLKKRQRLVRLQRIRRAQDRRTAEDRLHCMNCGATLSGPFCHICGQKDGDIRRPIWSMLAEILDDFFSADSRIIKTIIMLVAVPGGLTRSFMSGQRATYVMPMRLYLAISVLFFLILSVSNVAIFDLAVRPKEDAAAPAEVGEGAHDVEESSGDPGRKDLIVSSNPVAAFAEGFADGFTDSVKEGEREKGQDQSQEATSGAADTTPQPGSEGIDIPAELEQGIADLRPEDQAKARELYRRLIGSVPSAVRSFTEEAIAEEVLDNLDGLDEALDRIDDSDAINGKVNIQLGDQDLNFTGIDFGRYDISVGAFVPFDPDEQRGFDEADAELFLTTNREAGVNEAYLQNVLRILQRPDAFNDLFNDWLPIALFILMPLFALFLRLTHWGGRRVYLHQLVFSLHFHSFLFLLMIAFIVFAGALDGPTMGMIFWAGTSLYLIIALKVGQSQAWWRAILKAGFIWVGYIAMLALILVSSITYGIQDM